MWCGYSWKQAFSNRFGLANGTFAKVLQVREENGRLWAMKTVTPALDGADYLRSDFLTELCVGTLRPMPVFNTQVHEAFEWVENGIAHYAMAMPHLVPLNAMFSRHDPGVKNIMAQVALGLWRLHTRGIIHRDVGHHNVMARDHHGTYFSLIDYGLAHVCAPGGGRREVVKPCIATEVAGTGAYMAPTVARGQPYGVEVDWYSWGQLLVELLVGDTVLDRIMSQCETRSQRKLALQDVQSRYAMLDDVLQGLTGVPSEVIDLVRSVLGPNFEEKLSKDRSRRALQSSDIERHPVLAHPAWSLATWSVESPRSLWQAGTRLFGRWRRQPQPSALQSVRSFWRGVCERRAEQGGQREACEGIFSKDVPRREWALAQKHANACPSADLVGG